MISFIFEFIPICYQRMIKPQPITETERGILMISPPSLSGKGAGGLGGFESDLVLLSDTV